MEEITKIPQMNKSANTEYVIHELLRDRWSPRMFSGEEITDDDLNTLFEAARWAPSSNNLQPWRFICLRKGTPEYDKAFDCLAEFNQRWVGNAPVLILTAYKEKTPKGMDNFHAPHDLGLAVANLSIQAQAMGIAIHQMAGLNWKKAQEVFNVPEGFHITTAIAVGFYGGDPDELDDELKKSELKERKRKPVSEFVGNGQWPS